MRPVTIAFEYQDAAGLHARKQFSLAPNSYEVTATIHVTDGGGTVNPFVQWGPGLGDVLALAGGSMFMPLRKSEALFSIDGDVERIQAADLATTPQVSGELRFCRRRYALLHVRGREAGRCGARVLPAVDSIENGGRRGVARLRRRTTSAPRRRRRARRPCDSSSDRSISKR